MAEIATVTPPCWLDERFLEESLKTGFNNNELKIEDVSIKPAVAAGDNYASLMFRAKIVVSKNGRKEQMSIIIKTLPPGEILIETVHEGELFTKETEMLTKTLPEMYKLFSCADADKISPHCFYSRGAPDNVLMMEDLCVKGYRIGDRHNGLDLHHSTLVIKSMARFHAGLLVLTKNNPELKQFYGRTMWSEEFDHRTGKFLKGGLTTLAEEIATWEDYPKKYSEKLLNIEKDIQKRTYDVYRRNDNLKFNTILHGDAWVNNMMFQYNTDNEVVKMTFVDFQLSTYNSPMLDLNYFIFTSVKQSCRCTNIQHFLQTYYQSFMNTLAELNHDIQLTFDELKNEFYSRLFFGFISSVLIYPITCAPPTDVCDINDLLDDTTDYKNKSIYQNTHFQCAVRELLPFFEKHNVI